MKKIIKRFTFITMSLVMTFALSSCKGLLGPEVNDTTKDEIKTEVNDEVKDETIIPPNGGKTPKVAMESVGKVNKVYEPIGNDARFVDGQIFKNYGGPGIDAIYEGKLVEYNSLDPKIINYLENPNIRKTDGRHLEYGEFNYNNEKRYVEFSSFTDIKNKNIIKYDLVFFDQSDDPNLKGKGQRISFSPDLTMDIGRLIYIESGERCPPYKYGNKLIN